MALENSGIVSHEGKTHFVGSAVRKQKELALLKAARSGQSTAFAKLCEQYTQQLFRAAHRITRSREDAEDAVQEALLSAFIHFGDFDGRSSFGSWLTRIGINSALMQLRKRRRWREVLMDDSSDSTKHSFWDVPDSSPNPETSCLRRERDETLRQAIVGLRPKIRQVIELGPLREDSMKQVAGIMGISTVAAKARLFHARRILRKSVKLRAACLSRSARRGPRLAAAAA